LRHLCLFTAEKHDCHLKAAITHERMSVFVSATYNHGPSRPKEVKMLRAIRPSKTVMLHPVISMGSCFSFRGEYPAAYRFVFADSTGVGMYSFQILVPGGLS
jgi:hypothetical protein